MLTRKEILRNGKIVYKNKNLKDAEIVYKTKIYSTAWYCQGCNGFIDCNGKENATFASGRLIECIGLIQKEYPEETFEVVPIEYNNSKFKPKKLTKILIKEIFF